MVQCSVQGVQVQSLVRELRSHMWWAQPEKRSRLREFTKPGVPQRTVLRENLQNHMFL